MNRFFKAVFCAVLFASLVGCGGDDGTTSQSGGDVRDPCAVEPVPEECLTVAPNPFPGLSNTSAITNFAAGNWASELELSTSLFYVEYFLADSWDKFVKLLGTGSWGAKYVTKKLASDDEVAQLLTNLIATKKFNKTYLSQFLDLTIVGAKLDDLLNALGFNDELRRFGIGFDLGDLQHLLLNTDLYLDRASVKIDQIGEDKNIVTFTTYITGSLDDLDDAAFDKIYGETSGKIVSTLAEKIYSPLVISNDFILVNYAKSLVSEDGFTPLGKREVVKTVEVGGYDEDISLTYSLKFDHGADLVTWSVEAAGY